jgi:hypothetical protein
MSGKVQLPGTVVWQEDNYAATIEGNFFTVYDVRLFWLNRSANIWHDQSYRNGTRTRFSSKREALNYANNDLRAVKKSLDSKSDMIRAISKDKNVSSSEFLNIIKIVSKL